MRDSASKSNDENSNAQTDANEKKMKYRDHNQESPGHSQRGIKLAQSKQLDRNSK